MDKHLIIEKFKLIDRIFLTKTMIKINLKVIYFYYLTVFLN